MPYQKQTGNTFYQDRNAFDKSKKLYDEHKKKSQADESFVRNYERTTAEFKDGLEQWSAIHERQDQEPIDFWNKVNPEISRFFGKDGTLWQGLEMKQNSDRDKALGEWRRLDATKKTDHKWVLGELIKKQGDLNFAKGSLADQARILGTKTKDPRFTAYADFIDLHNKTGNTAIYLKLMNERLQNYPESLRLAFSDPNRKYKDNDGNEFTALQIYSVPGKSQERISIITETAQKEAYITMDVGGLNNKIIFAAVDDKIEEANLKQIATLSSNHRQTTANANSKDLVLQVENALSLHTTQSPTSEGINWVVNQDGEKNPGVEVLVGMRDKFIKYAKDQNLVNPEDWADQQIAKGFNNFVASLPTAQQASAREFLQEVMGYGGLNTENTLKWDHTDGSGKQVTLAYISSDFFGANQKWKGDGGSPEGSSGVNTTGTTPDTITTANTTKLEAMGFQPPADENAGELFETDGTLNEKWNGTILYELESLRDADQTGKLEARITEVVAEMNAQGIKDPMLMNKLLYMSSRKNSFETNNSLKVNKGIDAYIVGKGDNRQIVMSDLRGWDQKTVNEILDSEEYKDVKRVSAIYGSSNPEGFLEQTDKLRTAITGASGGTMSIGSEAILTDMKSWVMDSALGMNENIPEHTRIERATNLALNEFIKAKKDANHEWHIDRNGNTPGQFDRSWLGNLGNAITGRRDRRELEFARTQLNNNADALSSKTNLDTSRPESSQILFLNEATLSRMIKKGPVIKLAPDGSHIIADNQIDHGLKVLFTKRGEWPIDGLNNQIRLLNEKNGTNIPLYTETPLATQLRSAISPKDYYEIIKIAGSGRPNAYNATATRKLNSMFKAIHKANGLAPPPEEPNVLQSFSSLFNNSLDTVDTSRSTDNPNLGKYNILESDVKAYYERNNLPYDRNLFLKDKDLQKTVATNLVSRLSLEAHSLKPTWPLAGGGAGKKMNGQMLRQLFNRLWTGEYENVSTGSSSYDFDQVSVTGTILDPVHTKGTLFLNNYRLYGVNK